jgi:hypothetical protein
MYHAVESDSGNQVTQATAGLQVTVGGGGTMAPAPTH